jgi:hypothetical protein
VNVINFYLNEENKEHRERIIAAALGDEHVSAAEVEGYVREAIRQDPVTVGVLRKSMQARLGIEILMIYNTLGEAISPPLSSQTNGVTLQPNERVFLSLKKAMMDVSVDTDILRLVTKCRVSGGCIS